MAGSMGHATRPEEKHGTGDATDNGRGARNVTGRDVVGSSQASKQSTPVFNNTKIEMTLCECHCQLCMAPHYALDS